MPPELLSQFGLLEDALVAAGFTVFAMVEYEADDAMGAAAAVAAADERVEQVLICTPDKDLGQCVVGDRVVQLDRRKGVDRRRRRGRGEVRRAAGVDPRLPRPRGRLGRRLPRPARAGGRSRPPPCSPGTATSRTSPPPRPTGTSSCEAAGSWRSPCRTEFDLARAVPPHRHHRARRPDGHRRRGASLERADRRVPGARGRDRRSEPRACAPSGWPRRARTGAEGPGPGRVRLRAVGAPPTSAPVSGLYDSAARLAASASARAWAASASAFRRAASASAATARASAAATAGSAIASAFTALVSASTALVSVAGLVAFLDALLELTLGGAQGAGQLRQLGPSEEQRDRQRG